jgi:hypothetical protein
MDDLPTFPARMLTTDTELVLDRRHTLIVSRTAGVKRNLEHGVLSGSGIHIDSAISAAVKMHVFTGVDSLKPAWVKPTGVELKGCWWIPRMKAERGATSWQHGGKRLRW